MNKNDGFLNGRSEEDLAEEPVIESVTNQEEEDPEETRRIEEEKRNTPEK